MHSQRRLNSLLKFIEGKQIDLAFGLGDFNGEFNEVFTQCSSQVPNLYSIFGNHDGIDLMERSPCWLHDGVNIIHGLRVFAVNGIWGSHPREKPWHRSLKPFLRLMEDAGQVDLLLTHEHPYSFDYQRHDGSFKFKEERDVHREFAEAVAKHLKPSLWAYGHSYTTTPDRVVLGVRTFGTDSRFTIFDSNWNVCECEELGSVPF